MTADILERVLGLMFYPERRSSMEIDPVEVETGHYPDHLTVIIRVRGHDQFARLHVPLHQFAALSFYEQAKNLRAVDREVVAMAAHLVAG